MLTHRGFSAWITSEGEQLREYLVAVDEDANRVSCWIPSEAGKHFAVHWKDEGTSVHSCSFISLDGFVVPGRFLFGIGEASREGIRTGPMTERPFIFTQHQTAATSEQCNRDTGTIVLKIKRVAVVGQKLANKLQQLPDSSASQSNLFSHRVGYGEERPTQEQFPSTWQVRPYDETGKRSYVTFVFRYRSREFLTSQGIMAEDDGTAKPVSSVMQKDRPSKRRVASAPLPAPPNGSAESLITPSPTPSPSSSKKKFERLSSSMKSAFNPASGRNRPAANVRIVSVKAPGRYDRYPGESTLEFYAPPNLSRFRKSPETDDDSQKTVAAEEDPKKVQDVVV